MGLVHHNIFLMQRCITALFTSVRAYLQHVEYSNSLKWVLKEEIAIYDQRACLFDNVMYFFVDIKPSDQFSQLEQESKM